METNKVGRLDALDFTKGALVLIMVFYHWLNYFVGLDFDYRYLRFLPPSFLFITGFLISHAYLQAASFSSRRAQIARRLLTRGLKLLGVFVVLNAAKVMISPDLVYAPNQAAEVTAASVARLFLVGPSETAKIASFYILIPISYLLVLSGLLVRPYAQWRYTYHAVSAVLVCSVLALHARGVYSTNLEFLTLGVLGMFSGLMSIARVESLSRHYLWLALAYACYLYAITVWNVPFGLLLLGVCLTLLVLYHISSRFGKDTRTWRRMILLGQYSLIGYIVQIAILQALRLAWRHLAPGPLGLYLTFVAAFVLTIVAVEFVAAARTRSKIVARVYQAAFA